MDFRLIVTSEGEITLTSDLLEMIGVGPGDFVLVDVEAEKVWIRPAPRPTERPPRDGDAG